MKKVLIIANALNRARIFLSIADALVDSGAKINFISLDHLLGGEASNILKMSNHPYLEFPLKTEKELYEMNIKERFRTLLKTRPYIKNLLATLAPDIVLLGAASYVEGVIIEQCRKKGIKTVLMQDGLRIYEELGVPERFWKWLVKTTKALVNEWSIALYGIHFFFAPFETNRVDRILLFGESIKKEISRKGVRKEKLAVVGNPLYDNATPLPINRIAGIRKFLGLPPERKIALFGMQCFHRHNVTSLDTEVAIVKDLLDTFRAITEFDLVIKLHPENNYELYRQKFFEWNIPNNVHLVKDEFTSFELLAASEVFLTVYSTMALESLVYGIPVITLDYTPIRHRLKLKPAIISASSSSELKKILNEWNDGAALNMKNQAKQVLDRELANLGFASEKASEAILELVK